MDGQLVDGVGGAAAGLRRGRDPRLPRRSLWPTPTSSSAPTPNRSGSPARLRPAPSSCRTRASGSARTSSTVPAGRECGARGARGAGQGLGRAGTWREEGPRELTVRGREQFLLLPGAGQQLPALRGGPGAEGSGQARVHTLRREHPLETVPGRAVVQRRGHPGCALGLGLRLSVEPEQGAPCRRGSGV